MRFQEYLLFCLYGVGYVCVGGGGGQRGMFWFKFQMCLGANFQQKKKKRNILISKRNFCAHLKPKKLKCHWNSRFITFSATCVSIFFFLCWLFFFSKRSRTIKPSMMLPKFGSYEQIHEAEPLFPPSVISIMGCCGGVVKSKGISSFFCGEGFGNKIYGKTKGKLNKF